MIVSEPVPLALSDLWIASKQSAEKKGGESHIHTLNNLAKNEFFLRGRSFIFCQSTQEVDALLEADTSTFVAKGTDQPAQGHTGSGLRPWPA